MSMDEHRESPDMNEQTACLNDNGRYKRNRKQENGYQRWLPKLHWRKQFVSEMYLFYLAIYPPK
jgi:hypothetical protein